MEEQLKRIADSLEVIAAALAGTKTDKPAEPKKEKKAKAETVKTETPVEPKAAEQIDLFGEEETKTSTKEVTIEDVREAVKTYAEKNKPEMAAEVLKKFKVTKIRELKPEQYATVVEAFKI